MAKHRGPRRPTDAPRGYCKPPSEHQFKPGKSGNPAGRPKGGKSKISNPDDILLEELRRKYPTPDGKSVEAERLLIRRVVQDGIRGKPGSQKILLEHRRRIYAAQSNAEQHEENDVSAEEDAMLRNFLERHSGAGKELDSSTYAQRVDDRRASLDDVDGDLADRKEA